MAFLFSNLRKFSKKKLKKSLKPWNLVKNFIIATEKNASIKNIVLKKASQNTHDHEIQSLQETNITTKNLSIKDIDNLLL